MPSLWANIKVGDDILDESIFDEGWRSDFTQPLDGGAHEGGILGTTDGFDRHPHDFFYSTDGQFKVGGHLEMHQTYATNYNYPMSSDQRNLEEQHYVHFFGNHVDQDKYDVNPDPMSFFEVRDDALVMKARRVTEDEKKWCRVKGYAKMQNGQSANYSYFKTENGESTEGGWGVPADWAPGSLTPPTYVDGDGNTVENGSASVFFLSMPVNYASTMISTYNRTSMSFGRDEAELLLPMGAYAEDNDYADQRKVHVWFPAFWSLQDVPAKCDINGRLHDVDTYTPANPGAANNLNEWDTCEIFGYESKLHVTSHHQLDGYGKIQRNHGDASYGDEPLTVYINKGEFNRFGMDRFPPFEDQPGLFAYHCNGKYIALYEMPDYIGQPKILYDPRPDIPYKPQMNADGTVKRLGSQLYENGKPAYEKFCQIFNIGMSAGFQTYLAGIAIERGTNPAFEFEEELHIKWTKMTPLKAEHGNPDSKPLIDYRAGDFGGSGSGIGPIYERFSTGYNNAGSVVIDGVNDGSDTGDSTDSGSDSGDNDSGSDSGSDVDVVLDGNLNGIPLSIFNKYKIVADRPTGGKIYHLNR